MLAIKKWGNKTHKEKVRTIVKILILVVCVAITVLGYVFSGWFRGEDAFFNKVPTNNPTVNNLFRSVPNIMSSFQVIVITYLINLGIRMFMRLSLTHTKRGLTIVKLLDSFVKYLMAIITILFLLSIWGVDTAAIIASAGILGLVVGLGAQSLIADIIAGIFIVFEGTYEVGDIIVVEGWRGEVDEIGIRTTKIVDAGGNVKIINNSQITTVINQTKELSLALCTVGIEYGENLERVEGIIKDNLPLIKKNIPDIVEGPFYKGVKALNTSSVDLLFVAKCNEGDIFQVQRDLNRQIKLIFDKNRINIPFPQVVINTPKATKAVSPKEQEAVSAKAKTFIDKQKKLSKNIEEQNS